MSRVNFDCNDNIISQFGLKRKRILPGYSSTAETVRSIRGAKGGSSINSVNSSLRDLTQFVEGGQLDRFFSKPGIDNESSRTISETLYDTNLVYQKILNYYTSMYYWRYVTTPRLIKGNKKLNHTEYAEMYNTMLEISDGMSIEVTFPRILLKLFQDGQVFLYAAKDTTSKTITTLILPAKYCRTGLRTQFGTTIVEFDFSFFAKQGLNKEEIVQLLAAFPDEFAEKYDLYCSGKDTYRWQALNGKCSTALSMNDCGFPTFLSLFYDIIDYKTYKMNELDRNTNKLERLVSQEIDLEKTGLDLAEVKELHDSMADIICENKGSTLVTSVGSIDVHQLQEDTTTENDALNQAYNSIYSNAGINYNLFNGSIAESLDASLKRDLSFVWTYVEQLVNFYNLAINNLVNFKGYQYNIRVLPISIYNEQEKLEFYRANAQIGIGKLDLLIASGIKQVDLESTLELEEYLDLTERLVPLKSSYTLSSSDNTESKADDKEEEEKTSSSDSEEKSEDSNIKE